MIKEKHIKNYLSSRLDKWFNSLPSDMKISHNCFIAGGSIVSLLLNESINDIDLYLTDKDIAIDLIEHYMEKIRADGEYQIEKNDEGIDLFIPSPGVIRRNNPKEDKDDIYEFEPVLITENSINLKGKIQIIIRFVGEPEEVIKCFDFAHTNCYFRYPDKLEIPYKSAISILEKELVYTGTEFPLCSLFRIRKFIKRGWKIHAGEILKIVFQLQNMNLNDIDILQNQLTGVDSVFFNDLLVKLKEEETDKISETYLAELIDDIFG